MILQGKARTPVTGAVLHCAAVPTGWAAGRDAHDVRAIVDEWHRQRGWRGIGYHAVFMPDGSSVVGRPWVQIGAHVEGHNTGTLGFLMVESRQIDRVGMFADWFTPEQGAAVRDVLRGVPGLVWVKGHNDFAPKLCPGFKVQSAEWLGR